MIKTFYNAGQECMDSSTMFAQLAPVDLTCECTDKAGNVCACENKTVESEWKEVTFFKAINDSHDRKKPTREGSVIGLAAASLTIVAALMF